MTGRHAVALRPLKQNLWRAVLAAAPGWNWETMSGFNPGANIFT
jgi:hypothetical protein